MAARRNFGSSVIELDHEIEACEVQYASPGKSLQGPSNPTCICRERMPRHEV